MSNGAVSPGTGLRRLAKQLTAMTRRAEVAEFPPLHTAKESVPLFRCEPENRAIRIAATTDTNPAVWQIRYLDTIAVGET